MELPCHLSASLEGVIPFRAHSDFPQTTEYFHCFSWGKQWRFSPICWYSDSEIYTHLSALFYCPSSAASSWKPTGQSHIPTLFRHSCFGLWGRFSAPSPFIIINNAILSCKQIINYGSSPPSKTTLLFPHLLRIALSPLNHFTANLIHFTVVVTDISSWLQLFIFVMTEEIEGNGKYLDNKIVLEKSYQFFVSYWAVLSRRHIFFCRCFWGRIALLAVFFREITHLTTLVKYTDIC